ncbi:MAG: helix-turn-helix domain-containing protein [Eubacteriales bacterium]|nr:helix-turn-helix domain-containing protein [Eubacteriales bacterium]
MELCYTDYSFVPKGEFTVENLNIGKKIQNLRLKNGLSVRKLSSEAGITPSMLSQIENDQVNPSINTLRALSDALDTPLYHFFKEDTQEHMVVTPDTRKTIGTKSLPDVTYELLTPDTRGSIEFCMMVIPSSTSSNTHPQSHTGEEVAFLYSGESVELETDTQTFTLRQGDSIRIPAETPHIWHNRRNSTVQVIFAITPPSF